MKTHELIARGATGIFVTLLLWLVADVALAEPTLPALVIAHQVHADATRENEIIKRNAITHPGFVQAGYALEVLTDV